MTYGSVLEFLRDLKRSGGSTPRDDHRPICPALLRRLFREAPRPFRVGYNVLYAQMSGSAAPIGASESALTDANRHIER